MNTTLAIRKSCSTSDVGLLPNVTQVAASDVGDDPAVQTFSQNVQKVQDEITALKAELAACALCSFGTPQGTEVWRT